VLISDAIARRWTDGTRLVVTGATGWLGRCLVDELVSGLGPDRVSRDVLLLASHSRSMAATGDLNLRVHAWTPERVRAFRPTHAVHLAFLTRERSVMMDTANYVTDNLALTGAALDLLHEPTLRGMVVSSSGVAASVARRATIAEDPYAVLKEYEEDLIRLHAARESKAAVVCRVWSVSGPHMTKAGDFALGSFILQALRGGPVRVEAGHPVWRTYVDAGQMLGAGLCLALEGTSLTYDSGGVTVEVEGLARLVAHLVGPSGCPVVRAEPDGRPDDLYVSPLDGFQRLAARLGLSPLSLEAQVLRTSAGIARP